MSGEVPRVIHCAIYTRKSREFIGDYSSCEAQFDACLSFLQPFGRVGWYWNGQRYDDEGESSERRDRPGLTRLMADIAAGTVDRVVVYRLDRLARRLMHSAAILKEFRDRNVGFTIVTSPELGRSAQDSLVLNILSSFGEFELELTRERLREARHAYKNRGLRIAGVVPLGYQADPRSKQLTMVDEEACQVLRIFELAAEGRTPQEIAALINQLGWRTKRRISQRSGKVSGGNLWTARQILATISNPVYRGLIRNGASVLPGQQPAMVSDDLWQRVSAQVNARRDGPPGPRTKATDDPLRGILFCGRCERKMGLHQSSHGNIVRSTYRCRSTAGGRPPCPHVSIPVYELTRQVLQILADPQTYSGPFGSEDDARVAAEFCDHWMRLTPHQQRMRLPEVLGRVVFDPDELSIKVTLDRTKLLTFLEQQGKRT